MPKSEPDIDNPLSDAQRKQLTEAMGLYDKMIEEADRLQGVLRSMQDVAVEAAPHPAFKYAFEEIVENASDASERMLDVSSKIHDMLLEDVYSSSESEFGADDDDEDEQEEAQVLQFPTR